MDCMFGTTVDSEKMSKSLGNFFTIRDVLQVHHPLALRWFLINTQYRQPVNYTERGLLEVVTESHQQIRQMVLLQLLLNSALVERLVSLSDNSCVGNTGIRPPLLCVPNAA